MPIKGQLSGSPCCQSLSPEQGSVPADTVSCVVLCSLVFLFQLLPGLSLSLPELSLSP